MLSRVVITSLVIGWVLVPTIVVGQGIDIQGPDGKRVVIGGTGGLSIEKGSKSVVVDRSSSGVSTRSTNSQGTVQTKQRVKRTTSSSTSSSTSSGGVRTVAPKNANVGAEKLPGSMPPIQSTSGSNVVYDGNSGLGDVVVGSDIAVTMNEDVATYGCTGQNVMISGNENEITLTGECKSVLVSGNKNDVVVEAANDIVASGNKNEIQWTRGTQSPAPRVRNTGNNNVISQAR